MNYFLLIEILGSILYFSQKIFLSFGKRIGWLFGFLGAIAFTIVTLHKGSFAYSVLEITSGIVFLFGLFAWKKNNVLQKYITLSMSIITFLGILLIFIINLGSPNWLLENSMVMAFIVGAVLLVLKKSVGWILYIVGHLILIVYAYTLATYFILLLQIISLPFAIIGYRNLRRLG